MSRQPDERQIGRAIGDHAPRSILGRRDRRCLGMFVETLGRVIAGDTAAHMAGFADQSHFNRHFKAAFGMTPSWWQRSWPTNSRDRIWGRGKAPDICLEREVCRSRTFPARWLILAKLVRSAATIAEGYPNRPAMVMLLLIVRNATCFVLALSRTSGFLSVFANLLNEALARSCQWLCANPPTTSSLSRFCACDGG